EELASRGLAVEEQAVAATATPGQADLVAGARFDDTDELEIARAPFKSAATPSFPSTDTSPPRIFPATRSPRHQLDVRSEDVDEALAVLESEISEEELAAQAEAAEIEDEDARDDEPEDEEAGKAKDE